LALADAEDNALVSKSSSYNAASLLNLRTVCVRLLSAAMSWEEFSESPKLASTRFRVVQLFFKSLYSKSDDVVNAAKDGLKQSTQNKLPKDLLQTGLRPILLNLGDHKRLTVDGLQGLGRLLELLTSYFKVEIGRKLLDHLSQWATPEALVQVKCFLSLGER
jgi:transformation/transcription domain-associated protein